ncbi:MAG: preQ(1) synthase [Planctomycetes bacterium]|nr:preQ(1) synthase [Planctomycetota bacterium]
MPKKLSRGRTGRDLPTATLGTRRKVPYTYEPALLEAIPLGQRDIAVDHAWVSFNALRFTSLCPVTGHPDWADLFINYIPDASLVESKSFKEYLTSFRMHGDFHEDVCRTICDDLVRCMRPRYCEVIGHFDSRGSIAIWPYVQYAKPGDAHAQAVRQHRLLDYAPGKWAIASYGRNV